MLYTVYTDNVLYAECRDILLRKLRKYLSVFFKITSPPGKITQENTPPPGYLPPEKFASTPPPPPPRFRNFKILTYVRKILDPRLPRGITPN